MRLPIAFIVALSWSAPARADLEPTHLVNSSATKAQRESSRAASEAAQTLGQGDFNGALSAADRAIATDANDPWAHYVRGEALIRLGRLDDGLAELRLAERAFPEQERWSRSIALWGRANALYQLGRCADAKAAFADYIAWVKSDDRRAVEAAQAHVDGCRPPWVNPIAAKTP